MLVGGILMAILCAWGCFRWLNEWLPNWIIRQNFWLIEFLYRFLNVLAPIFLLYSLLAFKIHLPSIVVWIVLYVCAHFVKKITWDKAYGGYLD